jgi:adenine phosphoribosyltransferase
MPIDYEKYIGVTEGFPKPGISFKDISPLLADPKAWKSAVNDMVKIASPWKPDLIIGPESRGFIFGSAMAYAMGCGFVMARKKGKLPGQVARKTYTLEYAEATIEMPALAVKKGQRVVLVDDLLATGGTLKAVEELVESLGGKVVGALTFIELTNLNGKQVFTSYPYASILKLSE